MRLLLFKPLFPATYRLVFAGMLLFGFVPQVALAQAPVPVETTMENMLSAIQSDSLAAFVSAGDPAFKAGITEEIFHSISESLGSRLKQGYTAKFLTQLNQQGFTVYLWKLEFKDASDDVLVSAAIKDGNVSGFWLR
jgi:hypothetical protein